jgi:hypothetical protein
MCICYTDPPPQSMILPPVDGSLMHGYRMNDSAVARQAKKIPRRFLCEGLRELGGGFGFCLGLALGCRFDRGL